MTTCYFVKDFRRKQRELRKKHRKCFWTWPLGHCYCTYTDDSKVELMCCMCHKPHAIGGLYGD